jgi:hypothetical protein
VLAGLAADSVAARGANARGPGNDRTPRPTQPQPSPGSSVPGPRRATARHARAAQARQATPGDRHRPSVPARDPALGAYAGAGAGPSRQAIATRTGLLASSRLGEAPFACLPAGARPAGARASPWALVPVLGQAGPKRDGSHAGLRARAGRERWPWRALSGVPGTGQVGSLVQLDHREPVEQRAEADREVLGRGLGGRTSPRARRAARSRRDRHTRGASAHLGNDSPQRRAGARPRLHPQDPDRVGVIRWQVQVNEPLELAPPARDLGENGPPAAGFVVLAPGPAASTRRHGGERCCIGARARPRSA